MKMKFVIFCLSSLGYISCASSPEVVMVDNFKKWVQYMRIGDLDNAINLTGNQMKAKWLYRIYETTPFNEFAARKYKELSKDLEPIFDQWLTRSNIQFLTYKNLPPLPNEIEQSSWFTSLIREHYELGKDIIITEFKNIEVLESSVEFNEGTIIVRAGDGSVQMYVMKIQDGGWKVEWNKPAPR